MWYLPPTRRSIEHTVILSSNGANQLRTCSCFVNTSKTSSIGASNSRVVTISSSFGNSMTADPCRFGVTEALLVVVALVGSHPSAQRQKVLWFQAVQPAAPLGPAPDESHLTEHPEVFRNLRLGQRDVVH